MKPVDPRELVKKHLKGECTPFEEKLLHDWYNSFENNSAPLETLNEDEKSLLKERMFKRIIEKAEIETPALARVINLKPYYYAVASLAAVLLVFLSVTFYTGIDKNSQREPASVGLLIFRNTTSKLTKHVFPDGSIAWVRPSTELSYARDFNRGASRFVTMWGEAFFEVTKNTRRPFIIRTGKVYTKVLGTSFNVRCYRGERSAEVSVVTGKVLVYESVKNARVQEAYLVPHQKVLAYNEGKQFVKAQETNSAMDIWQRNDLSFSNTPVAEVVKALNERFNTDIIIKDNQINEYQLTADFTDVNLPSVLELLSKSLGITYEINNDSITMSKTN